MATFGANDLAAAVFVPWVRLMKHCARDTRHTRPNLDDNMMIYLKPVPSQGWLELWRAVVVECARRTAVISHSLVRWNTYMVEGLFIPGIFWSWMQLSRRPTSEVESRPLLVLLLRCTNPTRESFHHDHECCLRRLTA